MVEKANHTAAQRLWRTLPDDVTTAQAQQLLDTWWAQRGDVRLRATADGKATIAAREPLRPAPPVPFPATLSVSRTVSAQALARCSPSLNELNAADPGVVVPSKACITMQAMSLCCGCLFLVVVTGILAVTPARTGPFLGGSAKPGL